MNSTKDPDYRVTLQGVYDPPEPEEPLPEGLLRARQGPLNKNTGRRTPGEPIRREDPKKAGTRNAV